MPRIDKKTTYRKCQIPNCGTVLSGYNKGPFCYAHTPGNVVFRYHPKSLCTSRDVEATYRDKPQLSCGQPELYFDREVAGVIGGDHRLHEVDFSQTGG